MKYRKLDFKDHENSLLYDLKSTMPIATTITITIITTVGIAIITMGVEVDTVTTTTVEADGEEKVETLLETLVAGEEAEAISWATLRNLVLNCL